MKSPSVAVSKEQNDIRSYERSFGLIGLWVVATLVLQLLCSSAYGQQKNGGPYKTFEFADEFKLIDEDDDATEDDKAAIKKENKAIRSNRKKLKSAISKGLRAGSAGSIRADINKYMNGYLFPEITQTDSESLSRLGAGREFFFKNFLSSRHPAASRSLIVGDYVLPKMTEIVDGNFHPAVRLNAIVMLGLLNESDGRTGQPPELSTATLPILKKVLNGADYPGYLKIGAMAGIQRHVSVSAASTAPQIGAADIREISGYCLKVLDDSQTVAGQDKWSPDINYWMQRRSAQVLADVDENRAATMDVLLKVLATEPEEGQRDNYWVRFDALTAFASIPHEAIDSGKLPAIMDGVTGFTFAALNKEADFLDLKVEELIRKNLLFADRDLVFQGSKKGSKKDGGGRGLGAAGGFGEGAGGGGGGGGGDGNEDEEDDKPTVELPNFQLNASRSRIKAVLHTAKTAFKRGRDADGLIKVDPGQLERIESIIDVINDLMDESEYGLIDRSADEEETPKNVTKTLAENYRAGSWALRDLMITKPVMDKKMMKGSDSKGSDSKDSEGSDTK